MKFLPEVCLEPKNNPLHFKDDPDRKDRNPDPYRAGEVYSLWLTVLLRMELKDLKGQKFTSKHCNVLIKN